MAFSSTIETIQNARDIAIARGDISGASVLQQTLNSLIVTDLSNPINGIDLLSRNSTVVDTNTFSNLLQPSTFNPNLSIGTSNPNQGDIRTNDRDRLILSDAPPCQYRYHFGYCPVYAPNTSGGCKIFIALYRTCYPSGEINTSRQPVVELMGYIDITSSSQPFSEENDYVDPSTGRKGKIFVSGRKVSSSSMSTAINSLFRFPSLTLYAASDGIGIFRESTTVDTSFILDNLFNPIITSSVGVPPKGKLIDWANELANSFDKCDSSANTICIESKTVMQIENIIEITDTQVGKRYCDTKDKVVVPQTRRLLRVESRPVSAISNFEQFVQVPNKPCMLGIPRAFQAVNVYEEEIGYPCYATAGFNGGVIDYSERSTVTTTEFGEITTVYISERPDPNCPFEEVDAEYTEDDPANPCFGIVKRNITRKYIDGRIVPQSSGVFVRYFRKQDSDCSVETIKIFHPLDLGRDVVVGRVKTVTTGLFNFSQSVDFIATSPDQSIDSKQYFYDVYGNGVCDSNPFFAVSYGHFDGSGSLSSFGTNKSPSKSTYSQYRLMALNPTETKFTFYTNGIPTQSKDIYAINFYRESLSDKLDAGNFQLTLSQLNGDAFANNVYTGSNVLPSGSGVLLKLIDNSSVADWETCKNDPYASYDIVSGSLVSGIYSTSNRHTYGIVYPNLGIIVLDPSKLNSTLSFNTVTGSNLNGDNAYKLFASLSGSLTYNEPVKARNTKYKTTNHYYIRVDSSLANFSSNPTYVSGEDNYFAQECFMDNPVTYITTIGLYNDFNELLAVAKLSKPIMKSFDNDVQIQIRLNW
jgi:hypothetical protein